jgi:molecular chaperone GrpE
MAEEENELNNQQDVVNEQDAAENKQKDTVSEAQQEPTQEEKYAELNDRFIRLYAEFDNFRKRSNKEKVELISSANAGVLLDLLPVLDDFERAIQSNETAQDLEVIKEGFLLIFNKFKSILDGKGLKLMDAKGQPFDSELHEAIANVPVTSEEDKGKVIDDVEKGYYLHDKVIRFAKVIVGQ